MRFNDEVLTAIEFRQIRGTDKNGRDYNFPTLVIADDDLNRISVSVNRDDLDEGTTLPKWLQEACENKSKFTANINVRPDKNDKYGKQCTVELYDLRDEA